jgi:hypothetical protein
MSLNTAQCPVCKTPISETQFAEIQELIRTEESQKLEALRVELQTEADTRIASAIAASSKKFAAEAELQVASAQRDVEASNRKLKEEQQLRTELIERNAIELKGIQSQNEKSLAEAVAAATLDAKREVEEHLALLRSKQEVLQASLESAQQREAETLLKHRQDLQKAAEVATSAATLAARGDLEAMKVQLDELKKERDALSISVAEQRDLHQTSVERAVAEAKAEAIRVHDHEKRALDAAKSDLERRLESAEKKAHEQQAAMEDALKRQRSVLDEANAQEIAKIRVQVAQDNEALRKKLAEAERKLEQKTINELGQIPEAQLEKDLRQAFEEDLIVRVKPGEPGADLIQTVRYKGESCGKIILDSKNHLQWRDSFAEKLAQDCLDAEGKHAIVSTVAFPKGGKDLSVKDGVILAKPNQVVAIVDVLRRTMIQNHVLGLSQLNEGRKKDRLYQLITSDSYRQSFQIFERTLDELQQIDVDEAKEHKKVWEQRGSRYRRIDRLMRETNDSILAIVESNEVETGANKINAQVVRTRVPI